MRKQMAWAALVCLLMTGGGPVIGQTIFREYFLNIPGSSVSNLTSAPAFPASPSGRSWEALFEAPLNFADNFGTRMRGFVVAPVTGNYTFWIASDDASELYLSSNANPANAVRIARVLTWTDSRVWEEPRDGNAAAQRSGSIPLTAGQRYYIDALHKDGGGGDNLAVGWQLPSGEFERPIPGNRLVPFRNPPTTFVASGDAWRYLPGTADLPPAWRGPALDDSGWPSGPSPLGFGEVGLATVVNSQGLITTYFRRSFSVANAPGYVAGAVRIRRDDGAVVYLNGTEIFRSNMPTGAVTVATAAPSAAADDGAGWHTNVFNPNLLVNGVNVLAVEVHQQSAVSSDLTFDLELAANVVLETPPNSAPVISDIGDRSMPANTTLGPISFTVGDAESPADTLEVSAASSDSVLLPSGNISLGGTGANRVITLTPAPNQAGVVTVTVTVSDGQLTATDTFVLTVNPALTPPGISQQPASQTAVVGDTVQFAVVAAGSPPLSYQWFFNGAPLSGANGATLTLSNVQPAQAGNYRVRVQNGVGFVDSVAASLQVGQRPRDFGDAPDSIAGPGYPTLLPDGAFHLVDTNFCLGKRIDSEPDGQPDGIAQGDDLGATDDEDGTNSLSRLLIGRMATVAVELTAPAGQLGVLNAWIDFNANTNWESGVEHVISNAVLVPGPNSLSFPVPKGATLGETFARFRLTKPSAQGQVEPGGAAPPEEGSSLGAGYGEVEDYRVRIESSYDLAVTKTDTADPVTVGESFSYLITVRNEGVTIAPDVILADSLPSAVTFVSVTSSQGACAHAAGVIHCALDALEPGATASVTVKVTASAAGTVTNTASVGGGGTETDLADNRDSETTVIQAAEVTIPCDQSNKGTNFWLTFPGNYAPDPGNPTAPSLCLIGTPGVTGTVRLPAAGFVRNFIMGANMRVVVDLPNRADLGNLNDAVATNRAVQVTADGNVAVFALNRAVYSSDGFLALPSIVFGTEYVVQAWGNVQTVIPEVHGSQFAVVACEDGTTVTITPSSTVGLRTAGYEYTVILNKGDAYQLRSTNGPPSDLSGTRISADKPVGVFAGHMCANVPNDDVFACDYVVEQLLPNPYAGSEFITVPSAGRTGGDTFRILALRNSTTVTLNGTNVTLQRGERHDVILTAAARITSTRPVLVHQFAHSSDYDNVTQSDPFMTVVPDVHRFQTNHMIWVPASGYATNYASVMVPDSALASLRLNGVAPTRLYSVSSVQSSAYTAARIGLPPGTNVLSCAAPFGSIVYGYADFEAYAYPGALFFGDSTPPTLVCRSNSVTLTAVSSPAGGCEAATPNLLESVIQVEDNCAGQTPPTLTQDPPPGTPLGVGVHVVEIIATDAAGNSTTCSITVIVRDRTPPNLDCPANRNVSDASASGAVVTFNAAANDDCDSDPDVLCTPPSGTTFPVGTTTVTCVATDDSGNTDTCTFTVTVNFQGPTLLDFGDARDPSYPTLLTNDGARHVIVAGWYLGQTVDAEADGRPSADALGDDVDGVPDDEDGVRLIGTVTAGALAAVQIISSTNGLLDAWIDYNRSGTWELAEQIFTSTTLNPGTNNLTFTVPSAGIQAGLAHARFRLSKNGGLSPRGLAPEGEVEDYAIELYVGFSDQPAGVKGNATVAVESNMLVVANLGSSGEDGVQVPLETSDNVGWFASLEPVPVGNPGTTLRLAVYGDTAAGSNVFLAGAVLSNSVGTVRLAAVFPGFGGEGGSQFAEVWSDGLVTGFLEIATPFLTVTSTAPMTLTSIGFAASPEASFGFGFGGPVTFRAADGSSRVGDAVVIKYLPGIGLAPAGGPGPGVLQRLSQVQLFGANLPVLRIRGLDAGEREPRLRVVALPNGRLRISWLHLGPGFRLEATPRLGPAAVWEDVVPETDEVRDGRRFLQVNPSGPLRFYRAVGD